MDIFYCIDPRSVFSGQPVLGGQLAISSRWPLIQVYLIYITPLLSAEWPKSDGDFIAMQEAHLLKFHHHWFWPGKFSVMVFSDNSTLNKSNWKFNAGRFSIVRNKVSWECLCWPWNWIQINVELIIWWLLMCTCY